MNAASIHHISLFLSLLGSSGANQPIFSFLHCRFSHAGSRTAKPRLLEWKQEEEERKTNSPWPAAQLSREKRRRKGRRGQRPTSNLTAIERIGEEEREREKRLKWTAKWREEEGERVFPPAKISIQKAITISGFHHHKMIPMPLSEERGRRRGRRREGRATSPFFPL